MSDNNNVKINISIIDNVKCPKGYNPVTCPAVQHLDRHAGRYVILKSVDKNQAKFELNEDFSNTSNSFEELISMFVKARNECIKCQKQKYIKQL